MYVYIYIYIYIYAYTHYRYWLGRAAAVRLPLPPGESPSPPSQETLPRDGVWLSLCDAWSESVRGHAIPQKGTRGEQCADTERHAKPVNFRSVRSGGADSDGVSWGVSEGGGLVLRLAVGRAAHWCALPIFSPSAPGKTLPESAVPVRLARVSKRRKSARRPARRTSSPAGTPTCGSEGDRAGATPRGRSAQRASPRRATRRLPLCPREGHPSKETIGLGRTLEISI